MDLQYSTYNRSLLPVLRMNGLRVITEHEDLTEDEAYYVDRYFNENVYPVLTPMAFDSSRPFPLIRNKTLNIAALLRKKERRGGRRAGFRHGSGAIRDPEDRGAA